MFKPHEISSQYGTALKALRKAFHENPELGYEEHETTRRIRSTLEALGIETFSSGLSTGVIGLIRGAKPGKTVAIRADIDALPVEECPDNPICSKNPGVMHACSHDMHITILLGAAMVLNAAKDLLAGDILLIFQPAEETIVGAKAMLDAGFLSRFSPDAIIGGHVKPGIPLGKVSITPGAVMAAKDSFSIRIIGKGGHGAAPHTTRDPIVAAAAVIGAVQNITSREKDPMLPAVISICAVNGGTADNIIPDEVNILGSMRTFSKAQCAMFKQRLTGTASHVAAGLGCSAETIFYSSAPVLENDASIAAHFAESAKSLLGAENVLSLPGELLSEDFSCFAELIPACYCFIGMQTPGSTVYPLHNAAYFPPDDTIFIGAALYANTAKHLLENL
ncbi:MAG: amidohydrolase [Clostridiales bacterium]|nr:amidohydrolase [Clostridiales bacterium]